VKLLFDQNISFRVVNKLRQTLPLVTQVRHLGLENSSDFEIWEYAKLNGYTIVTFDADFYDIAVVQGIPPKVVWLRLGNLTTDEVANSIIANIDGIKDFLTLTEFNDIACLVIK
jgi:predicted nuclease of predicted toxin-antitoxin system